MIRQFRKGIHVDPDLVTGVTTVRDAHNDPIGVEVFQFGATARLFAYSRHDAVALADEIGTAARIAQEARLAADTRLHREVPIPSPAEAGEHMKCPECGSADRIPRSPTDTAGRFE